MNASPSACGWRAKHLRNLGLDGRVGARHDQADASCVWVIAEGLRLGAGHGRRARGARQEAGAEAHAPDTRQRYGPRAVRAGSRPTRGQAAGAAAGARRGRGGVGRSGCGRRRRRRPRSPPAGAPPPRARAPASARTPESPCRPAWRRPSAQPIRSSRRGRRRPSSTTRVGAVLRLLETHDVASMRMLPAAPRTLRPIAVNSIDAAGFTVGDPHLHVERRRHRTRAPASRAAGSCRRRPR